MTLNPTLRQAAFFIGAFMAAWQIGDFGLDYRTVLGAFTAAWLAGSNPAKTDIAAVDSPGDLDAAQ